MAGMTDFYAILKVQNGRIRKAMEDAGILNAAQLAKAAGKGPTEVGLLLNFKISPMRKDGKWRAAAIAISEALGALPEDLFPGHMHATLDTNQITTYVERRQLSQGRRGQLPSPIEAAEAEELKGRIGRVLETLTFREAEIVKLRYALDGGREFTLEDCAKIFKVSRERVRGIEAKAIRKIQRPARIKILDGHVEKRW